MGDAPPVAAIRRANSQDLLNVLYHADGGHVSTTGGRGRGLCLATFMRTPTSFVGEGSI